MRYHRILKSAWAGWDRHKGNNLSATLAFYSLLSLVPLVTVAMSLVTWLLGSESARRILLVRVDSAFGSSVAEIVSRIVENSMSRGDSIGAAVLAVIVLFIGVSGVAAELRSSLNLIWDVPTIQEGLWRMVKNRTRAFLLVLFLSLFILGVSLIGVFIAAAGKFMAGLLPAPGWVLALGNFVFSLAVLIILFQLIHQYVPDAYIRRRIAFAGAVCTAAFFTIGKELVTLYIGRSTVGTVFGPGRSVIILLLWAYFSSSVLFFGAEFARAYSSEEESKIRRQNDDEQHSANFGHLHA